MTKLSIVAAVLATVISAPAYAGEWRNSKENDPFDKTINVIAEYHLHEDSWLFITCSSDEVGLSIRRSFNDENTGYDMSSVSSTFKFAVDGVLLLDDVDVVSYLQVNSLNKYLFVADLSLVDSREFLRGFASAKESFSVKEVFSDELSNTSARGTSDAASALNVCLANQGPST